MTAQVCIYTATHNDWNSAYVKVEILPSTEVIETKNSTDNKNEDRVTIPIIGLICFCAKDEYHSSTKWFSCSFNAAIHSFQS